MIQGLSEIAAMCVGLIGMIGASVTTGLPMWKVTVFTGENQTEMETRWEGLWMNCHRDSSMRMHCQMYDSLLYLSPEIRASRGLMCCAIALSGLGLLVAVAGMRCTSCFQGIKWAKTVILMVAGGIHFMGCICVFIPVSWTGYVIMRDLHNPQQTDPERRAMGEALYIGWATGTFLLASALLFTCRCLASDSKPTIRNYYPVSTLKSTRNSQRNKILHAQLPIPLQTAAQETMNQSAGSHKAGNIHISENSLYATQNPTSSKRLCDPLAYNCYY